MLEKLENESLNKRPTEEKDTVNKDLKETEEATVEQAPEAGE